MALACHSHRTLATATPERFGVSGSLPGPPPRRGASPPSLALSSLNKHTEAVAYYKKALELDPDNETYKSNLKIAELKLRETPSPVSGPGEERALAGRPGRHSGLAA